MLIKQGYPKVLIKKIKKRKCKVSRGEKNKEIAICWLKTDDGTSFKRKSNHDSGSRKRKNELGVIRNKKRYWELKKSVGETHTFGDGKNYFENIPISRRGGKIVSSTSR